MDKKINLLFGILGAIILILLNSLGVYRIFDDSYSSYIIWTILRIIFTLLSVVGLISLIFFSILLIIDAFKNTKG
ncbi:hypothetical protein IAI10_20520 [Clostridium sp. 19966]|uniref:hypothetical protein n=1 Tax=Clostridium sp. 19966 TaxID=2768166 RepID=UPI0028DD856E|nr:hypothetical protein [Clostridium sp. 19966]MDT8719037.1 hypothetical protein [Clostridium sp. 19966]